MKISQPKIQTFDDITELSYDVQFMQKSYRLYFRVQKQDAHLLSEQSDAALIGLLVPAMQEREDIELEGTISERLYHNARGVLQHVLREVIPTLSLVTIKPAFLDTLQYTKPGVVAGFSGGIDSFNTLADYHYGVPPASYRLTHLLYNNVGSHGKNGSERFQQRLKHISAQAAQIGLPLVWVDTNLDDFYNTSVRLRFQQTHTLRNACVPHALGRGVTRFLYSSAYPARQTFVGRAKDTTHSDLITLPLLSSERLDALSVGAESTRVEKTLKTAQLELSYMALDVCTKSRDSTQCSQCGKCMRTMLTLEVAGLLDRYQGRFNIQTYRKYRSRYIAHVLKSKDPLMKELKFFLKEQNFPIPPLARLGSLIPLY